MSTPANHEDPGPEQPFISHLVELRDRILRMVVAVLLVFLALLPFANAIYSYVAAPLLAHMPEGTSMIATQVISPFVTPLKLTLVAAVFLTIPYLLYQLWGFVAPGLYRHERRLAVPLLVSSTALFYLGMLFAYYLVFPLIFGFLTGTAPEGVAVMTDISSYLDFVLTLFFAFGVAFEIPVATVLLVIAGIVTPEALAEKRPYVIVGVFVLGMLLTPPDVISQTLLAVPMWALFEIGIFFARLIERQRSAPRDAAGRQGAYAAGAAAAAPAGAAGEPWTGPGDGSAAPPGEGLGRKTDAVVGSQITGGDPYDPGRFRPMTAEEMEAQLDAIEAEEAGAPAGDGGPDLVLAKLQRVKELREGEDDAGARRLLYEVLAEGDEDQRRVARNILDQMDTP